MTFRKKNEAKIRLRLINLHSRYMPLKGVPETDQVQNVYNVSGNVDNGWTMVTFSRPLDTGDATNDFIFDGQSCAYFLFAWRGGVDSNGLISFHTHFMASTMPYCFTNCNKPTTYSETTPMTTVTTAKPTLPPGALVLTRVVRFSFKIIGEWKDEYANMNSLDYLLLKNRVVSLVI